MLAPLHRSHVKFEGTSLGGALIYNAIRRNAGATKKGVEGGCFESALVFLGATLMKHNMFASVD